MLKEIEFEFERCVIPAEVQEFLTDANQRIDRFIDGKQFAENGFVACDHHLIARSLIAIQDQNLASGNSICEWGSGFGGVASVASMLGFEAWGIEVNREVLEESICLADDYGLSVDFIEGSFVPDEADDLLDEAFMENDGDLNIVGHIRDVYGELEMEVSDFDLIFVFPWPNDIPLITRIFDRFASAGALLLVYNDFNGLKVLRKQFD